MIEEFRASSITLESGQSGEVEKTDVESCPTKNEEIRMLIASWIEPLGYQVIYLETIAQRQSILRIYIDHLEGQTLDQAIVQKDTGIGIQDCTRVASHINELLDQSPLIESFFGTNGYELEVSSPGVNRPLRGLSDFEKYLGKRVRIQLLRPLVEEEFQSPGQFEKCAKQKNFIGVLSAVQAKEIVLNCEAEVETSKKMKKKKSQKKNLSHPSSKVFDKVFEDELSVFGEKNNSKLFLLPLALIAKANLEPRFDFEVELHQEERE